MHKPESVLRNKTLKILWDSEIQSDHIIPARRPDLVIGKTPPPPYPPPKKTNENLLNSGRYRPADHRMKIKENEKRDKYLDLARELKKATDHEDDGYTNCD